MRISAADVTFYIPVRNAARTLAAAVESVRRQTVTPADIFLLVDTRSRDESVALARATGARIVAQHDGRLGHARNLAVQACKTRWLASCDADVTLEPDWLIRLMERVAAGVAMVGGCTHEKLITAGDRWRAVNMPHNWGAAPFDNPFMLVSEMLADTQALRNIGGYRADLQSWEDSDCCQRLRHAGYTLRYEPRAVAWHDRRDSVESVLELRWFYASYRQKQRFESIPGLIAKLATNRTYCLQSLSQTLHSDQSDTCAVAAALWFHHARRDLLAALDHWPMLDDGARGACVARLAGTIHETLTDEWPAFAALLGRLLPIAFSPRAESAAIAARDSAFVPTPECGMITAQSTPMGLAETSGFQKYLCAFSAATIALLRELPRPLRAAVVASGERLAAIEAGAARPPAFHPPALIAGETDRSVLSQQQLQPAWSAAALQSVLREAGAPTIGRVRMLEWGRILDGERLESDSAKGDEALPWLVLLPHLEDLPAPRAAMDAALATADWAVVGYQSPSAFLPSVPIPAARDLASWSAALGFEIRDFYTEAGLTRLVLRRRPMPRVPVAAKEDAAVEVAVR